MLLSICASQHVDPARKAFKALLAVLAIVDQQRAPESQGSEHHPLLVAYIDNYFVPPKTSPPLFEQLSKLWAIYILEVAKQQAQRATEDGGAAGASNESVAAPPVAAAPVHTTGAHKFAWFLFSIILRALTLHAHSSGALLEDRERSQRMSESQKTDLRRVFILMLPFLNLAPAPEAAQLNTCVALFLKDLLAIADRGFVFDLAFEYTRGLSGTNGPALKVSFVRALCDYEHYIAVNLPLPDRIDVGPQLTQKLWQKHLFVGLLLDVVAAICATDASPVNRLLAVNTLRASLQSHDVDVRYQDAAVRERISGLYFPFILMFVAGRLGPLANKTPEEKQTLLLCFIHILTHTSRQLLHQWWTKESQVHLKQFFFILNECVRTFEYNPMADVEAKMLEAKAKSMAALQVSVDAGSVRGKKISRKEKKEAKRAGKIGTLSSAASLTPEGSPVIPTVSANLRREHVAVTEHDTQRAAHLCQEVSLTILDTLMGFMVDMEKRLSGEEDEVYMEDAFSLFIVLLQIAQADSFLPHIFRAVRSIVYIYSKLLFLHNGKAQVSIVGQLTYYILRHCNANNASVRSQATSLIYLMLRKNFQERNNISRMKLQMTIAVERMVQATLGKEDSHLRRSLLAMSAYAKTDKVPSPYAAEVDELVRKLVTSMENHVRMGQYAYDPEITAELFLQTSFSYTNSPDLRVTWLSQLAEFHKKNRALEESAQCKIVMCGIVCMYLQMLNSPDQIAPAHLIAFRNAAPTLPDHLKEIPHLDTEEGICTIKQFTRDGLYAELQDAISLLKQREQYELAMEVYRLLTSIHHRERDFDALRNCFTDLEQLCHKIVASVRDRET
eukprot:TRINITY_DN373_c1_g3_i4.p1 TRINITY_DN373_c1_g3~~TRINITY_DN373_c1_g3_i4.p1  ORF type:complete len:841 (+),score=126.50 TRINITY_DN373_c1_g3_i4:2132-4654(+)